MKKMSMSSLLSAARVFAMSYVAPAKPLMTLTAPTIDLESLRSTKPRAVFAMPRADGEDPAALVGRINVAFEEFKKSVDEQLKARVTDTVLSEKVDAINAEISQMMKAFDEQSAALAAARLGGGNDRVAPEVAAHRDVFNTWFRKGVDPAEASMREFEVKASLTTQSDPDGGYLVPEQMDTEISRVLGSVSIMRQIARVIPISTGTYTKLVNLGGTSSGWVGEEETRPETAGPRLAKIAIEAMELYANPAATQTLLDDSRVDIAAWLAEEVSIEFSEKEGSAFWSGDGVKRPRGVNAYPKVANGSYAWGKLGYVVSGAAADFIAVSTTASPADALIDLYYALKSGYRANASWVMSDLVMNTVRKFKDADGAFIWAPPSSTAEVATILGKPVYNDDNLDGVGAGKFPVAFGDFRRGYTIVDRMGTRVLRDPYTNKPFVHFYTTKRVGGGITNFEAIKLLKIGTS